MGMQVDIQTKPYRLTLILHNKIGAPLLPTILGVKENGFVCVPDSQSESIMILAFFFLICVIFTWSDIRMMKVCNKFYN